MREEASPSEIPPNSNYNLVDNEDCPAVGFRTERFKLAKKRRRRSIDRESIAPELLAKGVKRSQKKSRRVKKTRHVTISESTKTILNETQVVAECSMSI